MVVKSRFPALTDRATACRPCGPDRAGAVASVGGLAKISEDQCSRFPFLFRVFRVFRVFRGCHIPLVAAPPRWALRGCLLRVSVVHSSGLVAALSRQGVPRGCHGDGTPW